MRHSICPRCNLPFEYKDKGPCPRGCPTCLPIFKQEYEHSIRKRLYAEERQNRNNLLPRFSHDEIRRWHRRMDEKIRELHEHPPNLRICLSRGIGLDAGLLLKAKLEG